MAKVIKMDPITPEPMTFNKVLWTIFAFRSIEILLTNIFLRV